MEIVVAAELNAPVDVKTYIPLPIVPKDTLPPPGRSHGPNGVLVADWHHPYHPREMLMKGTPGQIALRNCRMQWVDRREHDRYHALFVGPTPLREEKIMATVLLSAAGHIPQRGIRFDQRGDPTLMSLSDSQRRFLWRSGQIKIANQILVRDYILNTALQNGFRGINARTIDEFLNTRDLQRKVELGNTMLGLTVYDMVEPVSDAYADAKRKEYLPPESARTVGRFALSIMGGHHKKRVLASMEQFLNA